MKNRIVIVGMGIAGLVAALGTLQNKQEVFIIDRFEFFSRNQTVILNDESVDYFKELYDQINSLKRKPRIPQELIDQFNQIYNGCFVNNDKMKISIKYLQRMLFIACQIAELVFKSNFDYRQGEKYQILSIDIENQNIILKDTKTNQVERIGFKYLVDASGSNRVTKKYSSSWPREVKELTSTQQYRSFSCIMQGTLEDGLEPNEAIEAKIIKKNGNLFYLNKKFNLELTRLPLFGFSITQKKKGGYRFHMAGELPDNISHGQVAAWATSQLFPRVKQSTNDLKIAYKDPKLSRNPNIRELKNKSCISIFDISHSSMEEFFYSFKSQQVIVIYLGDARFTHLFHLGEGANKAIQDGIAFSKSFEENGEFNIELLKQFIKHDFYTEEDRQLNSVKKLLR